MKKRNTKRYNAIVRAAARVEEGKNEFACHALAFENGYGEHVYSRSPLVKQFGEFFGKTHEKSWDYYCKDGNERSIMREYRVLWLLLFAEATA